MSGLPMFRIEFEDARCLRCGIEFQHDVDRGEDYCPQCEMMFAIKRIAEFMGMN